MRFGEPPLIESIFEILSTALDKQENCAPHGAYFDHSAAAPQALCCFSDCKEGFVISTARGGSPLR